MTAYTVQMLRILAIEETEPKPRENTDTSLICTGLVLICPRDSADLFAKFTEAERKKEVAQQAAERHAAKLAALVAAEQRERVLERARQATRDARRAASARLWADPVYVAQIQERARESHKEKQARKLAKGPPKVRRVSRE